VFYAVLEKVWPQNTGIEVNAILGIVAFSGLAAIGAWKDVHGVQVWSLKRIRAVVAFALVLDIAHVVLLGLATFQKGSEPRTLPIAILHIVFPALRVLLLVPLLFTLTFPRVVYIPIDTDDITEALAPTASSFLLPAGEVPSSTGLSPVPGLSGEASKYGTFRSAHPAIPTSGPTTRAHTPVPSQGQDKVCSIRVFLYITYLIEFMHFPVRRKA
jgi:ATP-binding cassette subfamily B (MDR/TAP) protein 6